MSEAQTTRPSQPPTKSAEKGKDAIDHVRTAAQDLHKLVSDAAAKKGDEVKAAFFAVPEKTEALIKSIKGSLEAQNATTKKQLSQAMVHLDVLQKDATAILKSSAQDLQTSARQALASARASVQQISEAVATKRGHTSEPAKPSKTKS